MQRIASSIAARLLLFNVLLVFLPIAGLFSLRAFEKELLDAQERAMVQQARLVAATLSGKAGAIDVAEARGLIARLRGRSESRIRIVDRNGNVVADSATSRLTPIESEASSPGVAESRDRLLYRVGAWMYRVAGDLIGDAPASMSSRRQRVTPRDVARTALGGRYGATVTVSSGQRSLNLYVALPVNGAEPGDVIGAALVSQSTSRILRALWRVRLDTIEVFALSVLAATVLSLLVSATIARPLIRLRNEADELLDHRGRLRKRFGGSRRRDEIGDLTRALEQLTTRLERHLAFVETFAADVSHEFKNPLASIRSAAELLAQSETQRERDELLQMIEKEVARLTRLLRGVTEVSRVDAAVDTEVATTIDVREVWAEVAREREPIDLAIPKEPLFVNASALRLHQAFANVADNAISFSSAGRVAVTCIEEHGAAVMRVDDAGPGIPPEHLDRIFDRFFSFRPDTPGNHDGLGLAITRAIIEGYGGTVHATNLPQRGARFELRLPIAANRT